ncbi:MAG: NAD(P)/FAD-dependent oxidoreductase [Dehalococcoidia bacterium]|nr:NAD(P)/FAD-dependent oxidoreductase [Dehalococcoidia bacterium]
MSLVRTAMKAAGLAFLAILAVVGFVRFVLRDRRRIEAPNAWPRIVVLGAGFGGLSAVRTLHRRLGDHAHVRLIDRHNDHLFTPLLYEVATWALDPYEVASPLRQYAGRRGIEFRRATVQGIDFERCRVLLDGDEEHYDYLIIALGSATNFFGNESAQRHALPLKWIEDGLAIRNHVIDMLEEAVQTREAQERRRLLTFVIVGGGSTGVEAAAALMDFLRKVIPSDYPLLSMDEARVVVVELAGRLLGHMGERMAKAALTKLRESGVEVWLNTRPAEVLPDQLLLADGRRLATRTMIWATGVRAPDLVTSLDAPHGSSGGLLVDQFLQVQGRPGVYAVGDNAHIEDPRTREPVPLLAQSAEEEGKAAAENVVRSIRGRPQKPFRFRSKGNVISLGGLAGAAEIGPFLFEGILGWAVWRGIHLMKIASVRNRVMVALDWAVGILYGLDTARLEMQPVPHPEDARPAKKERAA